MIVLSITTLILTRWHSVNTQVPADYPTQVPGTCGSVNFFDCGGGVCIDVSKIRDCVVDCPNGSDEKCGNGYVLCDKTVDGCSSTGCGKCVKSSVTGTQCFDQRYTKLCDNPTVYPFKCRTTTNCLSANWLMDGYDDCGDSSDEDPCFTRDLLAAKGRTVKCDPIAICNYIACPTASLQCTCPVGYTGPSSSCQLLSNVSTTSAQTTLLTTVRVTTTRMTTTPLTSTAYTTAISSTKNTYPTAITTFVSGTNGTTTVAPCAAYCKNSGKCLTLGQLMNSVNDCGDNSDEDLCYLGRSNCSSTTVCVPDIPHKSFTCSAADYTEDCSDLLIRYKTNITDGVYSVSTSKTCATCQKSVYCDFSTLGGGWTVIMRRQDGSENFYRNWSDYTNGFGTASPNKEFWIGNDYVSKITAKGSLGFELLVQMVTAGGLLFARYEPFVVGPAATNYQLTLGKITNGNADDVIGSLGNRTFQTYDRQTANGPVNCAAYLQSGWWLTASCGNSSGDLTVPYAPVATQPILNGLQWSVAGVPTKINIIEMKIRPLSLTQGSSTIIPNISVPTTPVPLHLGTDSNIRYSVSAIVLSGLILFLVT